MRYDDEFQRGDGDAGPDFLRRKEGTYHLLIENAPVAIAIQRSSRFLFANKMFAEMYLLENPEEVVGRPIEEAIAPEHREAFMRRARERELGNEIERHYETAGVRKSGEIFPLLVSASVTELDDGPAVVGFFQDITKHRRAEDELRASEERLRSVVDAAPFGAHVYQLEPDGRLVFVGANRSADLILKVDHQNFLGMTIEEAFPPLVETEIPSAYRRVAETGQPFEMEQIDYDDTRIRGAYEVHAFQIGKRRMAVFFRDVTERKRAEERIRKALSEKEILLRELYHRTKNNMSVIIALLGMQSRYFDDPRLREAFSEAQGRIRSMALVHQKLYEASDLSHVSLKDYIIDLMQLLLASHDISAEQVDLVTDMDDVPVLIDTAIPCGLVVNELLSNSLKYAFPAGRKGKIFLTLKRLPEGEVELKVGDDGVGLPAGYDVRKDGKMGLKTVFSLAENQLDAKVSFGGELPVSWCFRFADNLYHKRV